MIPLAAGQEAADSDHGLKLQPDATVITSCSSGSHSSAAKAACRSFLSAFVIDPLWHKDFAAFSNVRFTYPDTNTLLTNLPGWYSTQLNSTTNVEFKIYKVSNSVAAQAGNNNDRKTLIGANRGG